MYQLGAISKFMYLMRFQKLLFFKSLDAGAQNPAMFFGRRFQHHGQRKNLAAVVIKGSATWTAAQSVHWGFCKFFLKVFSAAWVAVSFWCWFSTKDRATECSCSCKINCTPLWLLPFLFSLTSADSNWFFFFIYNVLRNLSASSKQLARFWRQLVF